MLKIKKARIVGFDPGSRNFGAAYLEALILSIGNLPPLVINQNIRTHTFKPPKKLTRNSIREFLEEEIHPFVDSFEPDLVVLEQFQYRPSGKGRASENSNLIIGGFLATTYYPVLTISAARWKNWFRKELDAKPKFKVHMVFNWKRNLREDHELDALGMAIWCMVNYLVPFWNDFNYV